MRKKLIFILILIISVILPSNIYAASITSPGTYSIPAGTASDYLVEYDYGDNSTATIIANISGSGTYSYTKNGGGLGIINAGSFGFGTINMTVNGNLDFIRSDTTENDIYGIEAYSKTNLTVNGNYKTEQTSNITNNRYAFAFGVNSESESNIDFKKNVTINKVLVNSPSGPLSEAIGLMATSKDGATGKTGGASTITIGTDNTNICLVQNIKAINDNEAMAIGINADGESDNPVTSNVIIKSNTTIENIESSAIKSESNGMLTSVLGNIDVYNDLTIKNITSQTNNSYAVAAAWGGTININKNEAAKININGDIRSINCFNDENDKSKVNILLANKDSSITGAAIEDDSEDGIKGEINLTIKNDSKWNLIDRTRTDANKNLSEVNYLELSNATINMYNNEQTNQTLKVKNAKVQGTIEIGTDVKNIKGSSYGDYINIENVLENSTIVINAYEKDINYALNNNYKQWFASTPNDKISFIPGEAVINGVTYRPIIESDHNQSGDGRLDWYIVGYTTEEEFTVTFESNGGTNIVPITVPSNQKIDLNQMPTKDGYKFEGWYLDEELTNKVTELTVDKNITVYAKWSKKEGSSNPFTADQIITWIITLTLSLAVFIILIIALIKKRKEKEEEITKKNKKKTIVNKKEN